MAIQLALAFIGMISEILGIHFIGDRIIYLSHDLGIWWRCYNLKS